MKDFGTLLGRRADVQSGLPLFDPAQASGWRDIRVKRGAKPVRAHLAQHNGSLGTGGRSLQYRAGEHYILERGRDRFPVRRDIFEHTYRRRDDGLYEKRPDIAYRCVIADAPMLVRTLEGVERAERGDWIVQGVAGEVWPVSAKKARTLYVPA